MNYMPNGILLSRPSLPATTRPSRAVALARLVRAQAPIEQACYLVGAALIVSGVLHLGVAVIQPRPWLGPLSWRKPVSFGLSFGTTLIAVTWVSTYLRLSPRVRAMILGVFGADCVLEVAGITLQAWRHVPSHFNTESPLDAAVAFSLAAGGAVLVIVLGTLGITAIRGRTDAAPSMRLALRAGFALLFAGLAAGVAMIARGETLIRAGHRAQAYDTAGFLKGFHAATLHAVLVLPLLAWWLATTDRSEPRRTRIVAMSTAGYVVVAAATLVVSLCRAGFVN
jgi:hypothetical protein